MSENRYLHEDRPHIFNGDGDAELLFEATDPFPLMGLVTPKDNRDTLTITATIRFVE